MEAKEKAVELLKRFKGNEIIAVQNSKNKMVYPYVSKYIGDIVINDRSTYRALLFIEYIQEEIKDLLPRKHQQAPLHYWDKVKQEINKL
ncbi:hypothetical protein HX109_15435 [Galbibacter sp. BG1]|uniref:hypothetical protein n=1 Tax=Galbibacter sp. BG1 TaxID=1170699 RepID=UPI0015B935CB|nr:hypothetical protein [Galbibacter sp. BG1]QLE02892.1 hypothetical protein HX109_15435 [Galbibacter sp. BG1]